MGYARSIVLCVPLQNSEALESFVEDCLKDKVASIAIVGDGCEQIELLVDLAIVGDGSDETRFIATSSHPDETLEDVMTYAEGYASGDHEGDGRDGVQKVTF